MGSYRTYITGFVGSLMLTLLAFISPGGMAGVLMGLPAVDFQIHNSLFLVAHFHTMIVGGVLFGFFAGITYWFPKVFGFKLNERLGRYGFWCWLIGFLLAFGPLYILGLMGATRRLDHYDGSLGWQGLFVVAGIGVLIIMLGVGFQILQLLVSVKQRHNNRDLSGDPWNGRTLEWSTSSPAPFYNFAIIPHVRDRDPFWGMKQRPTVAREPLYKDIYLPKNSPLGLFIGSCGFLACFGIVWHMWWMAIPAICKLHIQ